MQELRKEFHEREQRLVNQLQETDEVPQRDSSLKTVVKQKEKLEEQLNQVSHEKYKLLQKFYKIKERKKARKQKENQSQSSSKQNILSKSLQQAAKTQKVGFSPQK